MRFTSLYALILIASLSLHAMHQPSSKAMVALMGLNILESLCINSQVELLGVDSPEHYTSIKNYIGHNLATALPTLATSLGIDVTEHVAKGPMINATYMPGLLLIALMIGQNYYVLKKSVKQASSRSLKLEDTTMLITKATAIASLSFLAAWLLQVGYGATCVI